MPKDTPKTVDSLEWEEKRRKTESQDEGVMTKG